PVVDLAAHRIECTETGAAAIEDVSVWRRFAVFDFRTRPCNALPIYRSDILELSIPETLPDEQAHAGTGDSRAPHGCPPPRLRAEEAARRDARPRLGRLLRLALPGPGDRKSTRLNSSHVAISYAVFRF